MTHLIILGSSNAVPSIDHENTHLAVITRDRKILVDCASNPVVRLQLAGLDANEITDIILTHFHPDHVSGIPLLLMDMWLMGRIQPLNIYGLDFTIQRVESMMALYSWAEWPNFFKVNFFRIPEDKMAIVLNDDQICIYSSPVKHFLPNICLRMEFKNEQKNLAYSCDTEPCQAVVDIARGVNILLHEASGPYKGHSSAAQAGDAAREAGVGELYLIHYPTGRYAAGDPLEEAREHFPGKVMLAVDFMKIEMN
jgi:ribonuclease Z